MGEESMLPAGGTVTLYEGAAPLRPATAEESAKMKVFATWESRCFGRAERLFVKRRHLV
jgi:hypothetical protein